MVRNLERALNSRRSGCRLAPWDASARSGMGPATPRQVEYLQTLLARAGRRQLTEAEVKALRVGAASDLIKSLTT